MPSWNKAAASSKFEGFRSPARHRTADSPLSVLNGPWLRTGKLPRPRWTGLFQCGLRTERLPPASNRRGGAGRSRYRGNPRGGSCLFGGRSLPHEEFERFEEVHGKAVWQEVLKPRREAEGPNWRPSWIEGVAYQTLVNKILWEQFYAARRVASLNSGAADALKPPAALKAI